MTSLKLNRRSKVWINPPGQGIIQVFQEAELGVYNLTNFSLFDLMAEEPLTFLYLSNELLALIQIHFEIKTKTFYKLDKYNLKFGQMYLTN